MLYFYVYKLYPQKCLFFIFWVILYFVVRELTKKVPYKRLGTQNYSGGDYTKFHIFTI